MHFTRLGVRFRTMNPKEITGEKKVINALLWISEQTILEDLLKCIRLKNGFGQVPYFTKNTNDRRTKEMTDSNKSKKGEQK